MIGNVGTDETKNSLEYTAKFFVLEADLVDGSIYWPKVGGYAEWAPEYSVITRKNKTYMGPGCWYVDLNAKQDQTNPGGEPKDDLSQIIERKYTWGEMFFPVEWFGVHKANKIEAGIWPADGGGYDDRDSSVAFLNIDNTASYENDFIFDNASIQSKGSANYKKSPFDSPLIGQKLIEQTVRVRNYSVVFHVMKNINQIPTWAGVNPVSGFGDPKKGLAPSPSADGVWRAVEEDITEVLDKKGKKWAKISRKMEQAPVVQSDQGTLIQLFFDPAKDPCKSWTWI